MIDYGNYILEIRNTLPGSSNPTSPVIKVLPCDRTWGSLDDVFSFTLGEFVDVIFYDNRQQTVKNSKRHRCILTNPYWT